MFNMYSFGMFMYFVCLYTKLAKYIYICVRAFDYTITTIDKILYNEYSYLLNRYVISIFVKLHLI